MKFRLLFILHLIYLQAFAQQDELIFHYNQRNGLPQNTVLDIYLDNNGFLWLTTEAGLVRYDGNQFHTFNIDNTPFITNDRFRYLEADKNGIIHTSTIDGKRFCINYNNIYEYKGTPNQYLDFKGTMLSDSVLSIILNADKTKWPFSTWTYNALNTITRKNGEIWIGGKTALYQFANGINYDSIPSPSSNPGFFTLNDFDYVYYGNEVYYIDYNNKQLINCNDGFKSILPIYLVSQKSPQSAVIALSQQRDVFRVFPSQNPLFPTIKLIHRLDKSIEGFLNEIVFDTISNNLFIASSTNGLYIVKKSPFNTTNASQGLVSDYGYYGHVALSDSTVLAANGFIFSKNTVIPKSSAYNLKDPEYYVLLKDKRGAVWNSDYRSIQYQFLGKAPQSLPIKFDRRINNLVEYGDSIIVIHNDSLFIIYNYKVIQRVKLNVSLDVTEAYSVAYQGSLILGLYDGVYKFNFKTFKLEKLYDFNLIRYLKVYNEYILGTSYGNGMFVIYNHKLIPLPKDPKFYLDKSHSIEITASQELFISTNNGLFQTNFTQIKNFITGKQKYIAYKYYNEINGIKNTEFNGGGMSPSVALNNGYLTFANMGGIVWFNPANLNHNYPYTKKLYIDAIYSGDKQLKIDSVIVSEPYDQSISFKIGCIHWQNPYNIRVSYLLEGYHKDFQSLDNIEQPLQLTDIPPGKYTLIIKSIVGFNKNDEDELVLTVIKLPKYYQTLWFRFLAFLFLVILILGSSYLYNLQLQKRNQELEQKVKERTSALEKTNATLLQSQSALLQSANVKNKLISIISHDIVTPLKFISMVSRNFKTRDPEILEKAKEVISEIHHTSQRLYDNAQNVLNWVRYQNNLITVNPVNVSPFVICEEIKNLFLDFATSKKNTLINNVEMDDIIKTDKTILTIILQNIVSNAVKYSVNSVIEITSQTIDKKYQITVTDNGPGIREANLARIEAIRNKNQLGIIDENTEGTGLGFIIIFELAELIGASILIESELNYGTKVSVTV